MANPFAEAKKNFGFGCMRMQMDGDKVDLAEFTKMVDAFMAAGFNYFDTAHVYLDGQSETALLRGPVQLPSLDYSGGLDHALLEFADILPPSAFKDI